MLWCALVKGGFIEGRARPNPPASQIRAVWWGLEASSQASERTPRLTIYKSFPEERAFSPLDPKWGLISPHVLGAERRRQAQHRCTPPCWPPLCADVQTHVHHSTGQGSSSLPVVMGRGARLERPRTLRGRPGLCPPSLLGRDDLGAPFHLGNLR